MFKVNNKNTRTTLLTGVFIAKFENVFTSVSIVDFGQINLS